MRTKDSNTIGRLQATIRAAIERRSAVLTHQSNDLASGKVLYQQSDRLADELVAELRKDWTITLRRRSQRKVKPL